VPTILRSGPYRIFFYSNDRAEPTHVHIERDSCSAKFWLLPVRLASNIGFGKVELNTLCELVRENEIEFARAWRDFFTR
jgi:hypothetical protein